MRLLSKSLCVQDLCKNNPARLVSAVQADTRPCTDLGRMTSQTIQGLAQTWSKCPHRPSKVLHKHGRNVPTDHPKSCTDMVRVSSQTTSQVSRSQVSARPHPSTASSKTLQKLPSKHRALFLLCLLYTSPSPRDISLSRMPSSA